MRLIRAGLVLSRLRAGAGFNNDWRSVRRGNDTIEVAVHFHVSLISNCCAGYGIVAFTIDFDDVGVFAHNIPMVVYVDDLYTS